MKKYKSVAVVFAAAVSAFFSFSPIAQAADAAATSPTRPMIDEVGCSFWGDSYTHAIGGPRWNEWERCFANWGSMEINQTGVTRIFAGRNIVDISYNEDGVDKSDRIQMGDRHYYHDAYVHWLTIEKR